MEEIIELNNNFFEDFIELLTLKKKIRGKRNEKAPVFYYDSIKPKMNFNVLTELSKFQIFEIDRSLLSVFGFPAYGVHCNGWQKKGKEYYMVLSKRSEKIKSFPGLFDNLIGGGQPAKLSFKQNLFKEGYEETGIDQLSLNKSSFNSFTKYLLTYKNNFNPSVIATFDLEIKNPLSLNNTDGEIENFKVFHISEVFELLENNKLKPNAIIPIVNFILKRIDNFFNASTLSEIKSYL